MKTDILGPLTGALNSKEASAFRTSDFFMKSKWSAERTQLFDTLVADPECTFERQEALFSDSAYLKVLVKERHRMYTELLSFLIDFSRRHPETPDPWRPLDEARVLFSNGMLEQAVESVKEGISVAEQVHDLHAQLLLREQLRSIYKLMPRGALSKEITDNDYRLDMVTKQVTNLTRFTAIFDSLSDYQLKFRVADDISVRSAMEALMADDLLADMGNAISLPAQIRFASIWAFYSEFIGRLEDAERHHNQCLSLWESSPHRITYLPHLYREALANLIGLLVRVGDLGQIPLLLKRMEHVSVKGRRAEVMAFCDVELQHQFYYMNTGEFEKAVEREKAVNGGLTRFGRQMPESKELTLLYNYGVIHLVMGNDRMAKQYFSRIRDKGDLGSRFDLQSIARIFRLLLLMEDDTHESFSHYLRSNRRTFRKKMPFYRMEEVLYSWMGRHQSDYHTDGRKRFLMELFNALRPFEHERLVGAEEFRLWALSRATGQPMRQLLGTTRDK